MHPIKTILATFALLAAFVTSSYAQDADTDCGTSPCADLFGYVVAAANVAEAALTNFKEAKMAFTADERATLARKRAEIAVLTGVIEAMEAAADATAANQVANAADTLANMKATVTAIENSISDLLAKEAALSKAEAASREAQTDLTSAEQTYRRAVTGQSGLDIMALQTEVRELKKANDNLVLFAQAVANFAAHIGNTCLNRPAISYCGEGEMVNTAAAITAAFAKLRKE